jgi:hypothetical protein
MTDFNDVLGEDEIKKNIGVESTNLDIEAVTYACFIQDHSGSMGSRINHHDLSSPKKSEMAVENYNEQLAKLKKEADETMEVIVSVIEFDDEIKCPIENVNINTLEPIDDYWVGGTTALYDAIALGIHVTNTKMDSDPREDKAAILVIQTDGFENASSDFHGEEGRKRLKELIETMESKGNWSFTFLGEGIDKKQAEEMGGGLGVATANIMYSASNQDSIKHSHEVTQDGLGEYMTMRKAGDTQTKAFYKDKDGEDKGI